jgi:hypothetical protein
VGPGKRAENQPPRLWRKEPLPIPSVDGVVNRENKAEEDEIGQAEHVVPVALAETAGKLYQLNPPILCWKFLHNLPLKLLPLSVMDLPVSVLDLTP